MKKGVQGPLARSGNSPPPPLVYMPPPDQGVVVLFADNDLLVLSKHAGLLSVPGNKPELQDCLEKRAQKAYPMATTVHRLDRGTSGVFVMALNRESHRRLGIQFEKRKTRKTYVAMVSGKVEKETGSIDLPLRTDWYNRPKQMIDSCLGREAKTDWKRIGNIGNNSRMELYPLTGRSHQLRVHMQHIGHPILGDEFYAPPEVVELSNRLMLHAQSLELRHPVTNEWMKFEDPCPF